MAQMLDRVLTQLEDAHFRKVGLTGRQLRIVDAVALVGPLPIGELAVLLRLDRSTLSRNLQPLLRAGWLGHASGQDKRKNLMRITEAGRKILELSEPTRQRVELEIEVRLGAANCEALRDVLCGTLASLSAVSGMDHGIDHT